MQLKRSVFLCLCLLTLAIFGTAGSAFATVTIDVPTLAQTYNGMTRTVTATVAAPTVSVTSIYYSSASYPSSLTPPINAGSYQVIATGDDSSTDIQTLVVSPLAISIKATATTRQYGLANPISGTVVSTPALITGDTITSATYTISGATVLTAAGATTYPITVSAPVFNTVPTASNYTVTPDNTGTLTITTAPLTIAATAASRAYGAANPAGAYTITGARYNGDTVTGVTLTHSATAASNASSVQTITPSVAVFSPGSATNYNITYTPAVLTITALPISVAVSTSRIYGAANPTTGTAPAVTITSTPILANSDAFGTATFTVAGTATPTAMAGSTHIITPSAVTLSTGLTANYTITYAATGLLTVTKATPVVSPWPTASSITYLQTIASSNLTGGTFAPAGTFAFTNPATIPAVGTASQGVTFTPADTTNYFNVTGNVSVTVAQATPAVTWPTAAPITYGPAVALSTATLSGGSGAGTFAYTTPATIPPAGTANYSVTFTPTDTTNFAAITGLVSVTVAQATPVITWSSPSGIAYGTALTATQLNATATAGSGTAIYLPASGTVLPAGTQTLSVTFPPANLNYTPVTATVQLTVTQASLTLTAASTGRVYGVANPAPSSGITSTPLITGDVLTATSTYSSTIASPVGGGYTITPAVTRITNSSLVDVTSSYSVLAPVVGTQTISAATLTITANNASRAYGAANPMGTYTVTGLAPSDAISSVTLTTTGLGVNAGDILTVTPSAVALSAGLLTNYSLAYVPGTLTIVKATPVVTWPAPNVVSVGTKLSATQLNATVTNTVGGSISVLAPISGTPVYTPASGVTMGAAGVQSLSLVFTPTAPDAANYNSVTASIPLTVTKADSTATIPSLLLSAPTGVATDPFGYIYIADTGNNKVIMAYPSGATKLSIGNGLGGFTPTAGITGLNTTVSDSNVQLNAPSGVTVDANGNLYIADTGNNRVHVVLADTTTKLISQASKIVTIAGNGIAGFNNDGSLATLASINNPTGLAVDTSANLYIADNGNYRIRKVLAIKVGTNGAVTPGVISTVAGDGNPATLTAYGLTINSAGDLFIADPGNNLVLKMTGAKSPLITVAGTGTPGAAGDGGLATLAQLKEPSGVATDGKNLYIADTMNNSIRMVSLSTGVITTRAGSTGSVVPVPALVAPMALAVGSEGLYVADTGNNTIDQIYASVSAITTANPPGGTYATTQIVTLTASKAATITYTTKVGSGAESLPITYASPLTISGPLTTVLTFHSLDGAKNVETTNTATYVFDTTAPVTTISINATPEPNGAIYTVRSALTVTLFTPVVSPPSPIYYTTNGTIPAIVAANLYTGPFSIPVTGTQTTTNVQFFSVDAAGNKEVVQSQKYTVVALATTPSPVGGLYRANQLVTLATNDPYAPIYFTNDGTLPTAIPGERYANQITVTALTGNLKYFAVDKDGLSEQLKTQIYTIDTAAPTTSSTPPAGTYTSAQSVTLTPNDLNATIYYTTTGITPSTASAKYTAPIAITKTTTLMFFAMDLAGNKEVVQTNVYIYDDVAPITTASVLTGTYASPRTVTLTANKKATIYFTTDLSDPTDLASSSTTTYTGPIPITSSTTLRYFAKDLAGNKEVINQQIYTIITLTSSASPKGGIYNSLPTVALSTNGVGATAGSSATIYYTLDGTTPTTASTKYTTPLLMTNASTTLLYFAVDGAGVTESVKTEIYTGDFVAPKTSATCGSTANTIKLTATDNVDPMPRIQYLANTVTGATNKAAYTLVDYTTPITFTSNTIVKFFATDQAGNSELIKTAYCPSVVAPLDPNPAIYLETLDSGVSTPITTLFVNGNVAPFTTTTLNINSAAVATSTVNGAFTYQIASPSSYIVTATATNSGIPGSPVNRTITWASAAARPLNVIVGSNNGVKGNSVRVPISFTSGYQASAFSIEITIPVSTKLGMPTAEIASQAAALGKVISVGKPAGSGTYRILVMDGLTGTTTALPDGIVGYLTFPILSTAVAGPEALAIATISATDLNGADMAPTVANATNGVVNVTTMAGDSIGAPVTSTSTDSPPTLKGVLDALHMLLYPLTYPLVDGAADLNGDGVVQINEVQQVINTFVGL